MSVGSWSWKLAMSPASCTIDFDMPVTSLLPRPTVLNMFPYALAAASASFWESPNALGAGLAPRLHALGALAEYDVRR